MTLFMCLCVHKSAFTLQFIVLCTQEHDFYETNFAQLQESHYVFAIIDRNLTQFFLVGLLELNHVNLHRGSSKQEVYQEEG